MLHSTSKKDGKALEYLKTNFGQTSTYVRGTKNEKKNHEDLTHLNRFSIKEIFCWSLQQTTISDIEKINFSFCLRLTRSKNILHFLPISKKAPK